MWIVLFSKVKCTPLKRKVSTILRPIVDMEKNRNCYLDTTTQIPMSEYNILFCKGKPQHFYTLSETKLLKTPPPPLQWNMPTSLYL